MTAYERLLDRLRADGRIVKESRPGQAMAQCPGHQDKTPSLSVTRIEARTLVHCHAGCATADILAALGWGMAELYDKQRGVAYAYRGPDGAVTRTVHRSPDKRFRQFGDTQSRPTLYRLPEVVTAVAAGETVYLVEGEQDVHALESLGAVATTAPMGAGNWDKVDSTSLHGGVVVAVPDADDAGQVWADAVSRSLKGRVRSLQFRRAAVGKDAADHVAAGHTVEDLLPIEAPATVVPGGPRSALGCLLADLRTWQHLPDPVHVIVTLAAAATRGADGEPCWVLMVAPPSSGKTEAARLLDAAADARLDEVTAAGLLGWSKGKSVRPSGVLTRVGNRALVTFGDLSSLLATSDKGGREQVFGLLRRAYDGHVTRDISPPGKVEGDDQLEWSGRLTVVACVTGAIDRYSAHADQLGPRWVYVRIPDRSTEGKRAASQLARRSGLAEHRERGRKAVAELLDSLPADLPEVSDAVADAIEDAALVTAWGRGSVPRNGYGRREIEGVPVVEEPMRLVQQLGAVARGVLALGLSEEVAAAVARRVAVDSMPSSRRAVLEALSTGEVLSTAGCARVAGLDRKVARMALEELAAIGVVEHDREQDESDDHTGVVVNWSLKGDDGAVISDVFQAFRATAGGWDEKWVYTSTSPQETEDKTSSTGGQPSFRPTLEAGSDRQSTAQVEPEQTGLARRTCRACGRAMTLVEPGQTTHPGCSEGEAA